MAGLRFTDLQSRPMEFLDFTSLTLDEFQQLVPPFEAAFHARMAAWRMDGKPRTARRFTVEKHCPLPTPEDRLLFLLVSLKTSALQLVHGRLFGMVQGQAKRWMHLLLPALLAVVTGSRLPGVHAAPGGEPHADQEATGRGADPGAATGQSGAAPPPVTHRACAEQCQAVSGRQRPDAAVEGGCPRSRDGTVLCLA